MKRNVLKFQDPIWLFLKPMSTKIVWPIRPQIRGDFNAEIAELTKILLENKKIKLFELTI